jgi:putative phosphoesterase
MRLGFLSDAHGNYIGLLAAWEQLQKHNLDQIFFLGDSIGYLPDGLSVLKFLKSNKVICLCGNHEAMALGKIPVDPVRSPVYRLSISWGSLDSAMKAWVASWPGHINMETHKKKLWLGHGSPWDPLMGYIYPDSELEPFLDLPADVFIMGHTHRPMIKRLKDKLIINDGSCGLPRDKGGLADAVVYDLDSDVAQLIRTPIMVQSVLNRYSDQIHPHTINTLKR